MPFMALRVRSGDTFGIDPILLDGFLEFLRSPVGLEVLFRFVIACGSTINLSALQSMQTKFVLWTMSGYPCFSMTHYQPWLVMNTAFAVQ